MCFLSEVRQAPRIEACISIVSYFYFRANISHDR